MLDYLMGVLLIAAPWLLDFDRGGAETWVPVALGVLLLLQSLMTDYELGAAKVISMPMHLTIDLISGLLLAASPWIFGFDDYVYLPHLILGIAEVGASLMTRKVPDSRSDATGRGQSVRHAH